MIASSSNAMSGTVASFSNGVHAMDDLDDTQGVTGFSFYAWLTPGDTLSAVDYSFTSEALGGGTNYASDTASDLTMSYVETNGYGYAVDKVTAFGLDISLPYGTYWLTLQNAVATNGDAAFWDENDGPASAEENVYGAIGSEAFALYNSGNPTVYSNGPYSGAINAWTISDGYQVSNSFTLDGLTAGSACYSVLHDQTLDTAAQSLPTVLANASDPSGGPLSTTAFTGPTTAGGEVTMGTDGNFVYTPPTGYYGPDSFSYTFTDGDAVDTGRVHIDVTAVAVTNPGNQTSYQSDTVSLAISASDLSGGTPTYSATDLPGGLSINSATGVISGTIDIGATSTVYTSAVTATDGAANDTESFTWDVSCAPAPPAPGIATITVTTTSDAGGAPNPNDNQVSLREAIMLAEGTLTVAQLSAAEKKDVNGNPGANQLDRIVFNIPGGGVQIISPTAALPAINDSVQIDATTQPGYNGNPFVEINGGTNNIAGDGLTVNAKNSFIRGLSIVNFTSGAGVDLTNATGNSTVQACNLGVDPSGTASAGNLQGVMIIDSPNNLILANLISGNLTGVWISGTGSTQNTVMSNYIGTDVTGKIALPNANPAGAGDGVWIMGGATDNTIGGDYYTQGNLISGNPRDGVHIDFNSGSNTVVGNTIGLDITGKAALANGGDGVYIEDAANDNIIGGGSYSIGDESFDFGNIISGNTGNGIHIDHTEPYAGPSGTEILGNYIGLGSDGSRALGNGKNGILIWDSPNTWIGSGNATQGNVISANARNGIAIVSTSDTYIYGNLIGTDATGLLARGNQGYGIEIDSDLTYVGQAGANSRNVISGNTDYGIVIRNGDWNFIENNYIGLGLDGVTRVGNGQGGILVEGSSSNNTIGGSSYNLGNVISGNNGGGGATGNGITLADQSSQTTIAANDIGTDTSGMNPVGNQTDGIYIQFSSNNNIIGLNGAYNLISANGQVGIVVYGTDNTINYNIVGLDIYLASVVDMINATGWMLDGSGGITNTWGNNNYHN